MPPLLDVQNLTIEFPSVGRAFLPAPPPQAATAVAAVRELSFSIAPGEVLGLVGESGSGKSITALAIMGLLPPTAILSGDITFQNGAVRRTNLTTLPAEQLRHLRGSRIAMIFQEPMTALNPVMRVGDQIAEAVLAHNPVCKIRSLEPRRRSPARCRHPRPRAARPQLPAPALRRHAPARHDRHGHRQSPAPAHRRRAHHRARRHHPGSRSSTCSTTCATNSHSPCSSSRTISPSSPT